MKTAFKVISSGSAEEFSAGVRQRLGEVVIKTALDLQAWVRLEMAKPKTGREYRRGKKRVHVASAPGEAPAVDMGLLSNSIRVERTELLTAEVSAGTEYAEPLEFGTVKMAARPFMGPGAEHVRPRFNSAVDEVIRE